jgi:ubiquinone/menaquinone biosynthesis C-methylase UbiE
MGDADNLFTDGQAYERLMGRWSSVVGKVFLDWLDAPTNRRWLDVGCGNGAFTEQLFACCAPEAVIAIDPSDDQLAYARVRPGVSAADFRLGDAQNLLFADGSFDVAVMALVIYFLPDPDKAVAEMARVVRPGGLVAAYMWDVPGGGRPAHPIDLAMESMGMSPARPPNPTVSQREIMQAMWERSGLESVVTRVIRLQTIYSDFDDFWDSNTLPVGPHGKFISRMSPSEKEQLRSHLRDRLPAASNGRIIYEAFANAVKGLAPS